MIDVNLWNAVCNDTRLSPDAKFWAVFIADKSTSSEKWNFSVHGLASTANCGKDKVLRALRELEHHGYLIRKSKFFPKDKTCKTMYIIRIPNTSLADLPPTTKPPIYTK